MQFKFWIKEIIVLYRSYLIGTGTLQTLIFPRHMYRMPDLEKVKLLIHPQKFCYVGYEIYANYPLFLKSNLTEIKQYQSLWPKVELANLSMHNA